MNEPAVGRAFRIEGVVQGVGFRWFAREIAIRLGATGWIGNDTDGSVRGEVFGATETVAKFLAGIERGPTLGRVVRLQATDIEVRSVEGFEIRK